MLRGYPKFPRGKGQQVFVVALRMSSHVRPVFGQLDGTRSSLWESLGLELQLLILESSPGLTLTTIYSATATCKHWRPVLAQVRHAYLRTPSEANAAALRLCPSIDHVACCIIDDPACEREEGPTRDEEEMSARIPFALTALPALRYITIGHWDTNHNGSHPDSSDLGTKVLLAICHARRAGALNALEHIEHGCHICRVVQVRICRQVLAEGHTHIDPADADGYAMSAAKQSCICKELLRSLPARNCLQYLTEHSLCLPKPQIAQLAIRAGAKDLLNKVHLGCSRNGNGRHRPPDGFVGNWVGKESGETGAGPGPSMNWAPLFADSAGATYFDVVVLTAGDGCKDAEEYVATVNLFVRHGGVPSEPLRTAAGEGRVATMLDELADGSFSGRLDCLAVEKWLAGPIGTALLTKECLRTVEGAEDEGEEEEGEEEESEEEDEDEESSEEEGEEDEDEDVDEDEDEDEE
jgi:hypothetical protein